jgi:hypothetical protein
MPSDQIALLDDEQIALAKVCKAKKRLIDDSRLDWNEAFRYYNSRNEPFLEAWECPDFLLRSARMSQLEKEVPKYLDDVQSVFAENYFTTATPTTLARHLVELFDGYGWHLLMARMECERIVRLDLCRLALALAGYLDEHHAYPRTLAELCPKYLAALPNDPFSGKGLIYKPEEVGYLLYSVGPNGADDGGRNFMADYQTAEEFEQATEEEKAWDDIAIRVPPKKSTK